MTDADGADRRCCGCTGSATTARPAIDVRARPGWTRCGPRRGSGPPGCCPPPTAAGWSSAGGRHCVRFEFLPGGRAGRRRTAAPRPLAHFAELGAITARMHAHARGWARPDWFTRFRWDDDAAFGAAAAVAPGAGAAGDGVGVGPGRGEILGRLERRLRERLARSVAAPERFGLIHADTRLANLLVHEGTTAVIDFDDAGFGWYLYDLGTTVSFFEDDPAVPGLVAAWLEGYRRAARRGCRRGQRRDLDVHPVPAAAADRLDRLAPGRGGRRGAGRGLHPRQLRPGRAVPQRSLTTRALVGIVHIRRGTGGRRHRRQPRHRQGHRGGLRPQRGPGADHRPRRGGRRRRPTSSGRLSWSPTSPARPTASGSRAAARSGSAASTCCAPTPASSPSARLADMTEEDIDHVLGTNLKGTILSRAGVPAAADGLRPRPGHPDQLDHRADHRLPRLDALRREQGRASSASCARPRSSWPRDGITVNAVLPGNIMTEGLADMGEDYIAGMTAAIPMRQARHAWTISATRRCSSPPMRPPTSPARRSSWTAARCCPSHPDAVG